MKRNREAPRNRFVRQPSGPKNKFTATEDETLKSLVAKYGTDDWDQISDIMETKNARQCHDRWFYNLSPKVVKTPFTVDEDQKLLNLVSKIGPHWVKIAKHFPGKTDTQIKNRYKVLKKKKTSPKKDPKSDLKSNSKNPINDAKTPNEQTKTSTLDQIFAKIDNHFEKDSFSLFDDPFSIE